MKHIEMHGVDIECDWIISFPISTRGQNCFLGQKFCIDSIKSKAEDRLHSRKGFHHIFNYKTDSLHLSEVFVASHT